MENTTMRKMMLAATLLSAACGTNQMMAGGDDGPGSGGMDADVPTTCTTAADCGEGEACDLGSHECVSGALTIEPTEDIVADGARWWTAKSNPVLHGTFKGATGAAIAVTVGANASIAATLQGTTWTAPLPEGAITSSDTTVVVTMTDPSGGIIELAQLFALDGGAPQIGLSASKLHDERGDAIDFSSGEPVHTHAGADIDLDAGGCPSVYKYTYLMDAQNPTFGSQVSQNPLAWSFAVQEVKVAAASYRVRNAANQVLLDWTPATASTGNIYRVELTRTAVPQLGSYAGEVTVDLRVRDWTGLETTASRCVDFHPLAAPLQIDALQPSATQLGSTPALFAMSLAADSPISQLAGIGFGASLVSQRVVQYANEPIYLTLAGALAHPRVDRTYVDDYVAVSTAAGTQCTGSCLWDPPADPADSVWGGPASSWGFTVALVDEATNDVVTTYPLRIPARAPTEAPHAYRIVAYLGQLSDLRLGARGTPSEYSINNQSYTGYAPEQLSACTAKMNKLVNGEIVEICTQTTFFKHMVALDHAALQTDALTLDVQTSTSAGAAGALAPPYVPASRFATGPLAWDSGDDDLPGAH